ncbi:uncharacterized protein T551_00912, partial [Pneumocystis jirovecii RU7]
HSLARAVARAVKRRAAAQNSVEEEYLLALILENEYENNDKCKKRLKEYCEVLKNVTKEPKKLEEKLDGICKDDKTIEAKCKESETKVKAKCTSFQTELDKAVKKGASTLEDNDCKKNERQCLFLEGACPTELKDKCNELRNKCYQKKRDDVAEKALLRVLRGNLKDKNTCKNKLKGVCQEFNKESDELIKLCLDEEKTCGDLVSKKEYKCKPLKEGIDLVLGKEDLLKEKCLLFLEECYFYGSNCETDQPKCKEFASKCQKENLVYAAPGSHFDPTKLKIRLAEEIDLEKLYVEAVKKGIHIGRPSIKDEVALLALLSKSDAQNTFKDQCEDVIKKKCGNFKEHIILKDLCSNKTITDNPKEKCEELNKELTTRILTVSKRIEKYFAPANVKEIIGWHMLHTFLGERECTKLLSDCFYLKSQAPLEKPCNNLKAACYKKGLEAVANEALQDKLRGKLQGSNRTWLETLQKNLVKVCEKTKGESDELFVLCMNPIKTALTVSTDLRMRAVALQEHLNEKRDFPTEKDCKELEKKCEVLGKDSREIKWSCYTLKQHCNRLKSIEHLEEELLKENKGYLKDENSCKEEAKKRCEKWFRRENNKFFSACSDLELVCKKITRNVESKCNILKGHMETMNVISEIAKKEEKICEFWAPYCKKYEQNCEKLKNGGKDGQCKKLNKKCKSFLEKEALENKVVEELKGSLSNVGECNNTLNIYCTQLKKAENGLETLCKSKENTKSDIKVREELCEKLIKRIKEKCSKLKDELEEVKEVLEKKEEKYKKIKEEAEKAMEDANLILSRAKGPDNNNNKSVNKDSSDTPKEGKGTTGFKLVRRNAKVHVTEKELAAFDLVARAFDLYLELKEICNHSLKNCGFKKECDCEDPCKKIQGICSTLEPLKVRPHEIVTKNITTTTTTTTTTTIKDAKATDCHSLQTTDTWVTKTSTHTSTSTTTSTVTSRITLTSTRRCKPTKCTTGEEDEAGDVKPSEGLRMSGWSVMRGVLLAMTISFMI